VEELTLGLLPLLSFICHLSHVEQGGKRTAQWCSSFISVARTAAHQKVGDICQAAMGLPKLIQSVRWDGERKVVSLIYLPASAAQSAQL